MLGRCKIIVSCSYHEQTCLGQISLGTPIFPVLQSRKRLAGSSGFLWNKAAEARASSYNQGFFARNLAHPPESGVQIRDVATICRFLMEEFR
jgi:hypothetical protein